MKRPILERLREKPKEVRVQVSFLGALCVTGVIGLLWGVTLPARMQTLAENTDPMATEPGNELKNFFSDTQDNLGQIIGASGETTTENTEGQLGETGTYREGAPPAEDQRYNAPFEEKPVVMPVDRREVLIGTTTSSD